MKTESYDERLFDDLFYEKILTLESAGKASFSEKAKMFALDPENDFRFSDLRYSDFSGSDLRGYDFTGADLRHSMGLGVLIGGDTVFENAKIDGSIFASRVNAERYIRHDTSMYEILRRMSGWEWTNKLKWIFNRLYLSADDREANLAAALTLYHSESDVFGKTEIIKYLIPRMGSRNEVADFLLSSISEHPSNAVIIQECIKQLRKNKLLNDPEIVRTLILLLNTDNAKIKKLLVEYISAIGNSSQLEEVRVALTSAPDWLSRIYVREIARRHGEEYELISRHPRSNEPFLIDQIIGYSDLYLIARRWLRIESPKDDQESSKSLIQRRQKQIEFSNENIQERIKIIVSMLEVMNNNGCSFSIPDI